MDRLAVWCKLVVVASDPVASGFCIGAAALVADFLGWRELRESESRTAGRLHEIWVVVLQVVDAGHGRVFSLQVC